ncbi:MAG: hypothetical protein JST43_05860 [Bacteroidetes bacterium]|nr:hypothetical protein [Bacteroidota bacterium]MBS1539318.1 hypothetical protein [Bacteroidota bacterium]
MRIRSARFVLSLFILSASLVQLVELGHHVLHQFENPFHYHKVRKTKNFQDHTLADHHFPKMKFAYEMDEPAPPDNFIAIALGYIQPLFEYCCPLPLPTQNHFTKVIEHFSSIHTCPPTPPPLAMAAL